MIKKTWHGRSGGLAAPLQGHCWGLRQALAASTISRLQPRGCWLRIASVMAAISSWRARSALEYRRGIASSTRWHLLQPASKRRSG
jgi:hypothetical protein